MWLSGGESSSRANESQNFTCQRTTASEISPRRHCSSTSTSIVLKEVSKGITQSRQLRQAPSYFPFTTSTSSLLFVHPRRIQIYYSQIRTIRPAHQQSSHSKKVRAKLSHAPSLPLPRQAPSSLLHPTLLRLCPRAPPLFSLSFSLYYHYHIPRNYLSFI